MIAIVNLLKAGNNRNLPKIKKAALVAAFDWRRLESEGFSDCSYLLIRFIYVLF